MSRSGALHGVNFNFNIYIYIYIHIYISYIYIYIYNIYVYIYIYPKANFGYIAQELCFKNYELRSLLEFLFIYVK